MSRTHVLAGDRGQTAQDFAVGIGLFLVAAAFVFGFLPYVISPYDVGAGASEASQADRAATTIVSNLSQAEQPNELNAGRTSSYFSSLNDTDQEVHDGQLRNRTGLPFTARVNVTIENVTSDDTVTHGGTTWAAGRPYHDRFGGVSGTRIVRTNDATTCEPACRLVVRVW